MKMLPNQYMNFQYKDKTISRPPYRCNRNPYTLKYNIYIEARPRRKFMKSFVHSHNETYKTELGPVSVSTPYFLAFDYDI